MRHFIFAPIFALLFLAASFVPLCIDVLSWKPVLVCISCPALTLLAFAPMSDHNGLARSFVAGELAATHRSVILRAYGRVGGVGRREHGVGPYFPVLLASALCRRPA